jgi:FecR-like protein
MKNIFIQNRITSFFLLFSILITSHPLYAENVVGKATKVKGSVHAQIESQDKRKLSIGKSIFEKDLVTTQADSNVTLVFTDDTRFELGPDSSLQVNKYLYEENADNDSSSIEVIKGTFRFVSGLIAKKKPESMEVNTAVATIGIRGTTVAGKADATSAIIILDQPEDSSQKTAIEVSNKFGSVTIDEPGYGTEIPDEFSPPSPPRRMSLQTINNLTRSLQSIQRANRPRPMR